MKQIPLRQNSQQDTGGDHGKSNERIAMRISRNTIIGNMFLTGFKLFAGIFANSGAMVSDAVHSLSDVLATVIVMIGVKLANRKSDKEHQYGHERFECVAAIILAAILFGTGTMIGWNGIMKMMASNREEAIAPGALALIAAIVSIILKEVMYWYTMIPAKKMNSTALRASAWDHRSDALSSVGSFAGILGARLGFPVLDPAACVIICFFILKASIGIFMEAVGKMTDRACDAETESKIRGVILSRKSVAGIDLLRTRLFGDKVYVEVAISVDGSASLNEAHKTAQDVHDAVESAFSNVKHCTIHVNPVMWGKGNG
jgi:cation diffusion facilitator family transporter